MLKSVRFILVTLVKYCMMFTFVRSLSLAVVNRFPKIKTKLPNAVSNQAPILSVESSSKAFDEAISMNENEKIIYQKLLTAVKKRRQLRIVLDLQGAQTDDRFRGIGRYTISLAKAIVENRGSHEIIILLNGAFEELIQPISCVFENILPRENIRVWHPPFTRTSGYEKNQWHRDVTEVIREAFIYDLNPDIVFISNFFNSPYDETSTSFGVFYKNIPTVLTLHDLIPLVYPSEYLDPAPDYKKHYLRKIELFKKADLFLSVSNFSLRDCCKLLSISDDKFVNTGEGCDAVFMPISFLPSEKTMLLNSFGISRSFVFYVGGADSRKNLKALVSAYALLPKDIRKLHQLVIAGKHEENIVSELLSVAQLAGLSEDEMVLPGYVSDADLAKLYSTCSVFIFPSLYEGFGLPVLEAMRCGAPVIAGNNSSLVELVNMQEALFDATSVNAISDALLRVLADNEFRLLLIQHGLNESKNYSWDKTAIRAIHAFEKINRNSVKKLVSPEDNQTHLISSIAELGDLGTDADYARIAKVIAKHASTGYLK